MSRLCLYCERTEADHGDAFCGNDCEHDYMVSISDALLEGKPDDALKLAKARIEAMDAAEEDEEE